MKMIRNMAFCYDGKFYATQGGPVRLGYQVSEGQLPASWDNAMVTNYPQRITKDTIQFTLIDSDAPGITGSLSDFSPDDADAKCAKVLTLLTVIGDETSGTGCDLAGTNMGTLCAKSANAYVTAVAPSSITVDGERIETLNVTFRTTTPFTAPAVIPTLTLPVYEAEFVQGAFSCGAQDLGTPDVSITGVLYGQTMPAKVKTVASDPVDAGEIVVARGVKTGYACVGLMDAEGKVYYNLATDATTWVAAVAKYDRLVPVALYYKYTAT